MKRYRRIQHYSAPLTDIQAEAIIADRDYIPKVYGAAPAIVFTFRDMENIASIRRAVQDKAESLDIEISSCYERTKVRSAKQIAASRKWSARINGDGDKIHGFDDGESCAQQRVYTDTDTYVENS